MLTDKQLKTVNDSFSSHIRYIYESIVIETPDQSFSYHKEAFFWVLEKLLREGRVAFDDPYGELWAYDPYSTDPDRPKQDEDHLWKAKPEEIIAYLRERWPIDADHEHDLELNYYFYQLPAFLWRGEDGKWYGS